MAPPKAAAPTAPAPSSRSRREVTLRPVDGTLQPLDAILQPADLGADEVFSIVETVVVCRELGVHIVLQVTQARTVVEHAHPDAEQDHDHLCPSAARIDHRTRIRIREIGPFAAAAWRRTGRPTRRLVSSVRRGLIATVFAPRLGDQTWQIRLRQSQPARLFTPILAKFIQLAMCQVSPHCVGSDLVGAFAVGPGHFVDRSQQIVRDVQVVVRFHDAIPSVPHGRGFSSETTNATLARRQSVWNLMANPARRGRCARSQRRAR